MLKKCCQRVVGISRTNLKFTLGFAGTVLRIPRNIIFVQVTFVKMRLRMKKHFFSKELSVRFAGTQVPRMITKKKRTGRILLKTCGKKLNKHFPVRDFAVQFYPVCGIR